MLNGLSQVNIELCSACDKKHLCPMCGHQNPKVNPALEYGQMDWYLLRQIRDELPRGIVVQFHRDGEPTAYRDLGKALTAYRDFITSIVTHGGNLVKKADEIIDNCTTLTVSAFNGDKDGPEQVEILKEFLDIKGDRPPIVNVKIVGKMPYDVEQEYVACGVPIIRRVVHVPKGDTRYGSRQPTVPEIGVCLDFLHHPSIDWRGRLFVCNRLDTDNRGYLGDLNEQTLDELWNGPQRREWLAAHLRGRRDQASPLCRDCLMWGVPTAP